MFLVKNFFSDDQVQIIKTTANDMNNVVETVGKEMIYHEHNHKKSRIEYFLPYHQPINHLVHDTIKPFLESHNS